MSAEIKRIVICNQKQCAKYSEGSVGNGTVVTSNRILDLTSDASIFNCDSSSFPSPVWITRGGFRGSDSEVVCSDYEPKESAVHQGVI